MQVTPRRALGTGSIAMADGATLAITGSTTFTQHVSRSAAATAIVAAAGPDRRDHGPIGDGSGSARCRVSIAFGGGGTISLGNATNSYSGGTVDHRQHHGGRRRGRRARPSRHRVSARRRDSAGTLRFTSGVRRLDSRAITINAGGGAIEHGRDDRHRDLSATMSGSGTFTKSGTGTLTLGGTTLAHGNDGRRRRHAARGHLGRVRQRRDADRRDRDARSRQLQSGARIARRRRQVIARDGDADASGRTTPARLRRHDQLERAA